MKKLLARLGLREKSRTLSLAEAREELAKHGVELEELDIPLTPEIDPQSDYLNQHFENIHVRTNPFTGSRKLVGEFYRQARDLYVENGVFMPGPVACQKFVYNL